MPAPAAAGVAVGGGKVAGAGAAAGSTSSTGSAGAKAASKSANQGRGMDLAAQGYGGGGDDDNGGGGGSTGVPHNSGKGDGGRSKLMVMIGAAGVLFLLIILIPMVMMGASAMQCMANGSTFGGSTAGSLGGVQGTGVTREELKLIRSHMYAGNKVTEGTYSGTVYGPPWPLLAGTPDTSTGLELGSPNKGKKKYIVAMDPQLNNYGAFVYVWPNPHNWTGPFIVADTGQGRSDGIDFWEWRGMDQMSKWGRRNVKVSSTPIKDPPSTSGGSSSSSAGPSGYVYPLATQAELGGGVAAHNARAFGNWMSDNAVDMLVPQNTKAVATGSGRIYRLSGGAPQPCSNPAGYTVYLRSGGNSFSYMHLNKVLVRQGQRVQAGDVIGLTGSANCVEHLHFASTPINPETIVNGASASGFQLDVNLLQRKFGIPTDLPPIYIAASQKYGLGIRGPSILAAINRIETNFGELATATSSAGAVGWMQFMPATWAAYGVDGDGDGTKDPTNKWDAIFAAANYLKASGAPGDWYKAIFAYNHADWYVQDVLAYARKYFPYLQPGGAAASGDCGGGLESGPANIQEAVTLTEPRKWVPMPPDIGDADEVLDARIVNAARWISRTYNLHITQGGWQPGSPSVSHGYGTALDMVPKNGKSWDQTATRLAKDLGWTPECGSSGVKPACKLVPAIYNVLYNGIPNHGDPAHGGASAHIHVQFECACAGNGPFQKVASWVKTFPVGESSDPPKSDRPRRKKGNKT